jgi:hypothetical protein
LRSNHRLQRICRKTWAWSTNAEIRQVVRCSLFIPLHSIDPYPLSSKVSADACSVAAGIYDCGKKKAPIVTDAIQNSLIKSSSAVQANVRSCRNFMKPQYANYRLIQTGKQPLPNISHGFQVLQIKWAALHGQCMIIIIFMNTNNIIPL